MFCRRCGRQIDDNAKFCPYCGESTSIHIDYNEEPVTLKKEEMQEIHLNETKVVAVPTIVMFVLTGIALVLSIINVTIILKYIALGISVGLTTASIVFYIKNKSRYDFLVFAIAISLVLLNIAMIIYLNAII